MVAPLAVVPDEVRRKRRYVPDAIVQRWRLGGIPMRPHEVAALFDCSYSCAHERLNRHAPDAIDEHGRKSWLPSTVVEAMRGRRRTGGADG